MADMALEWLDFMEGTLKGMEVGISLDMHVRNVRAHIANAFDKAKLTPDIQMAGNRLLRSAELYRDNYDQVSVLINADEKAASRARLENVKNAYLSLRELIDAADPSPTALALGG